MDLSCEIKAFQSKKKKNHLIRPENMPENGWLDDKGEIF